MPDPLVARVHAAWIQLAGVPLVVPVAGGATVAVAPESWFCPRGWVGIVALDDVVLATAPDEQRAAALRSALTMTPASAATDPRRIGTRLRAGWRVSDVLGPAHLSYVDSGRGLPAADQFVEAVPADDDDVLALLATVPAPDADECGLGQVTSPVFTRRAGDSVVAAAGWVDWPAAVAHLCVLTAVEHRGRGLARSVASAAVAHAIAAGRLPQWRARPEPSRRVARSLGFREIGHQLSLVLTTGLEAGTRSEMSQAGVAAVGGREGWPRRRPGRVR